MNNPNNDSAEINLRELELGQCILVDLDFLIDTRMGALAKLNEDFVVPVMKKGYWKRQHDFFNRLYSKIDMEKYNEIYRNRDWEVLARSRLCNSILWLNALTRKMERRIADTPYRFPVVVYLNVYPYELTDQEIHVLASAIQNKLAITTEMRVIRKSNKELTPAWIKKSVALLAKYDGDDWLAEQGEALTKEPLPTITVVLPALLKDDTALSPMAKGADGKDYNLFEELPKGMAVLIDMTYIEPEEVSVINPRVAKMIKENSPVNAPEPPTAENIGEG